jgi:hypothetical protein
MNTKLLGIVLVFAVVVIGGVWYMRSGKPSVTSFEECSAAGYPVMESYPSVCRTPDGRTFTQPLSASPSGDNADLIRVQTPQQGATVGSPLVVTGEARGPWFFEASFPVRLRDASGVDLATTVATAQGEWMTEEFVPFTATLDIPSDFQGPATLLLQKDNPSGLPENDKAISIPVIVAAK